MLQRFCIALFFIQLFFISSFAQSQIPVSTPPKQAGKAQQSVKPAEKFEQEEVVKLGVTLVQIDAVVTGANGKYVNDLKAEDFEIYEDGKKQKITNFSYVLTQPNAPNKREAEKNRATDKTPLPVPAARLKIEQVRRTIALVVDDLSISFESAHSVRAALKKFVDEQMQDTDLVAIIRTGAGMGALQQFTSDKRQLYAAIERVRWNLNGTGGISAFAPISATSEERFGDASQRNSRNPGNDSPRGPRNSIDAQSARTTRRIGDIDQFREEIFSVGTLGAMNFIIRGLRDLPGRKSVVLFSDGIALFGRDGEENLRVAEAMRRLTDLANRASVVVYTIDSRGLQTLGITAADDTRGLDADQVGERMQDRRNQFFDSQQGLNYLAHQTGGFLVSNSNDLSKGVTRVLEDQKGYYLIGYVPDDSTFKAVQGRRIFHKLSIKVIPANLKVRYRTGFYGIADEEARPAKRTKEQQLTAALFSPFAAGEIPLRLTSLFGFDGSSTLFLRSLLHVDVNKLAFSKAENGELKTVVDFGVVTFKDDGQIINEIWRTHTLSIPENQLEYLKTHGLVYNIVLPVKKPGAYQLRTVVRDSVSEQVGSANQFVEVPDIKKGRLVLSGIVMQGINPETQKKPLAGQNLQQLEGAQPDEQGEDIQFGPAVRRIKSSMQVSYGFMIYNAQIDKATGLPKLEAQVRVLKEGEIIYTGRVVPVPVGANQDMKKILASGTLNFDGTAPGEYVFQVIVTDKLAKEKYNQTTQWIDFEVVK
jgi:VWFA-related protein